MNPEQVKSALRTVIVLLGGFAVGHGWITTEQVTLLSSDGFLMGLGTLATLAAGVWGLFVHKQANAVAVVAAMPEVAEVKAAATPEGRALVKEVGSTPDALVTVGGATPAKSRR
jgi:hypothetical protein